jgi:hypothetical protein
VRWFDRGQRSDTRADGRHAPAAFCLRVRVDRVLQVSRAESLCVFEQQQHAVLSNTRWTADNRPMGDDGGGWRACCRQHRVGSAWSGSGPVQWVHGRDARASSTRIDHIHWTDGCAHSQHGSRAEWDGRRGNSGRGCCRIGRRFRGTKQRENELQQPAQSCQLYKYICAVDAKLKVLDGGRKKENFSTTLLPFFLFSSVCRSARQRRERRAGQWWA